MRQSGRFRHLTVWAVAIVTVAYTAVTPAATIDFAFAGHTYQIVTTGATWLNAKAAADTSERLGQPGYLAIIDSAEENAALYQALLGAPVTTTAPDGGGARYAWFGGSDDRTAIAAASEGNFFWVDGRQFWRGGRNGSAVGGLYTNWGHGSLGNEPDNYNTQNFAAMGLQNWPTGYPGIGYGAASQWNDVAGSNRLAYVIEYNAVPEPATLALLAAALVLVGLRRATRQLVF